MTPELELYYSERFGMTATQGWKDLLEDAEEMLKVYSNIANCKNNDDLQFAKGQVDVLNWLLTLRKVSEEAYNQIQNDQSI